MEYFALGMWIVTMLGGAYLFGFTTGAGRPESTARATDLPPLVLFLHPTSALLGFVSYLAFIFSGSATLAWLSFGFLLLTATFGDVLAFRTVRGRREEAVRVGRAVDPAEVRRAESQMPTPAILLHGALAITTIVLVLVVAVRVSF